MTTDKQEFQGLSDLDYENERNAQALERQAYRMIEEAQRLLKDAAEASNLRKDDLLDYAQALNDTQADYSLSLQDWNAALECARMGEMA